MNETNHKYNASLKLAKIRGYKELRTDQIALIAELSKVDGLGPREIIDEVLDAPQHRVERTVRGLQTNLSRGLFKVSEAVKPKD